MEFPDYHKLRDEARAKLGNKYGFDANSSEEYEAFFVETRDAPELKREIINLWKSEYGQIIRKVKQDYCNLMSQLYLQWIQDHGDIPYGCDTAGSEHKLAIWYKNQRKKGKKIEIVEIARKENFNHIKRYKEWRYLHGGARPKIDGTKGEQNKLAKWALSVRGEYQKGIIAAEEISQYFEIFSEEWLKKK